MGNIAAKVTEKNTQNSIKETFTNSAEMGVVSQRDFFDHDIAKADKIDGYYIVQENDFIYNPRISVTAPCGPINRNKLGRKGVMSPLYTIFRTNGINPLFLEWYFKSSCWYAYMYFNGDSGARSDRFSIKNELFFDMPIPLPKDDEQWRIGLLLESLNNLITLHQRECFYIYKKYLLFLELQNSIQMNYSWEQRKLGDVAIEILAGGDIDKSKTIENGKYPIYANALTNDGVVGYYDDYYRVKAPAVTVTGRGEVGIAQARMVDFTPVVRLLTIRSNHDCYFLENAINNHKVVVESTGVPQLTVPQLSSYNIYFPKNIEEEIRIGKLLHNFDNLITLHQCESFKKVVAVQSAFARRNLSKWADSWEQRKLGDLVKEVTRRDPNSNAPIMMITANNGFIEQSERYAFNNAGESLKKYILLQKGELAYNHGASKLRPYGSCFALTTAENARIPFVYHCFSAERMNPEFLSIELNGNEIESQLRSIVSSGARMDGLLNISFGEYTSVSILFPKKNEQDKIADFFRQLDNLITLHQRIKIFFTGDYHDKKNK